MERCRSMQKGTPDTSLNFSSIQCGAARSGHAQWRLNPPVHLQALQRNNYPYGMVSLTIIRKPQGSGVICKEDGNKQCPWYHWTISPSVQAEIIPGKWLLFACSALVWQVGTTRYTFGMWWTQLNKKTLKRWLWMYGTWCHDINLFDILMISSMWIDTLKRWQYWKMEL